VSFSNQFFSVVPRYRPLWRLFIPSFRHYISYLEDGTCFDNSSNRGQPLYFILGAGQVIKGIELVLPILSRGERARIVVPAEV
jgi:hypothetical protein